SEKQPETKSSPHTEQKIPDSNADPDRPVLRRQPITEGEHEQTKAGNDSEALKGPIEFIPAISDAGGPDPRPYKYEMKPDEEQKRLKKMKAIATEELKARAGKASTALPAKRSARDPELQDALLHAFDLSNTNEPVLVLTANSKSGELTYTT